MPYFVIFQVHINDICHANGVKFFSADVFGFYGYMFADLGEHKYVEYVIKLIKSVYSLLRKIFIICCSLIELHNYH